MKLSGEFHIPLAQPQVNADVPQRQVPVPPAVLQPVESSESTRDYGYPEATPEERSKRGLRGGGWWGVKGKIGAVKGRGSKGGTGKTGKTGDTGTTGKPGDTGKTGGTDKSGGPGNVHKSKSKIGVPYKKEPQKSPGGPNSPGNAAHNAQAINNLQRSGFFPPISGEVAKVVRNAIVEAAVGGLVNLGFSVAKHVISDTMDKRIKAQSEMPGAEKKNVDGTKSTVDPSATQQQKVDARVEGAEINIELLANKILSINEGPDAPAVGKSSDAPTTTNERLTNLEKTLDAAEGPLGDIAERYGQVYTASPTADASTPIAAEERLDHIEQRYAKMNTMLKRLVWLKEAEAAEEE